MTRKQWVEIFVAAAAIAAALALPAMSQQVGIQEGIPIGGPGSGNGVVLVTPPDAIRTAYLVEGTITSINIPFAGGGPIVTLLDGLISFDVNGARIISTESGEPLAELRIGQRVTAILKELASTTGGMNKAETVLVTQDSAIATIRGEVEKIDIAGSSLTVLGWTIAVDRKTAFGGPREGSGIKGLADLRIHDDVWITATPQNRALYALRVMKMMEAPVPTETLMGSVVSIGTTSWVIKTAEGREVTVLVSAQTRIAGEPKVGDRVNVLGQRDAAGSFTALAIVKLSDPTPPLAHFRGVVTSITATLWKIKPFEALEIPVTVNRETKITGDPKIGDNVEVIGTMQGSAFVATSIIKMASTTPPSTDVSFEGVVKSIDGNAWLVDTVKVMVSRSTEFVGSPAVGDRVQVIGQRASAAFMATKIVKMTR